MNSRQQLMIGTQHGVNCCTYLTAGIVANNASGMCCGVANNTYNTLDHMRIVFADGTLLDTADQGSCASFLKVGSSWPKVWAGFTERDGFRQGGLIWSTLPQPPCPS
jgi:hypothetical protein